MKSSLYFILFMLLGLASARPQPVHIPAAAVTPTNTSLKAHIVTEFPKGTWVENLVIRQKDGNAVVTLLTEEASVYLVATDNSFSPRLLATIPGVIGLLGIVELGWDTFYVVAGNWSASTRVTTPGSYGVWEVKEGKEARKVADLPGAGFANGMTILNPVEGTVLVADSLYSGVWQVNVHTGEVQSGFNDTSTMGAVTTDGLTLGLNGVQVYGQFLYYSNTDRASLYRVPIDIYGNATGPVQTIASANTSVLSPDDFTIDFAGNAWMTADLLSQLDFIPSAYSAQPTGAFQIVAESPSSKITGWTAVKFGTKQEDLSRGSLYMTTNGGAINYFYSNWTAGGMLLRFDTAKLGFY